MTVTAPKKAKASRTKSGPTPPRDVSELSKSETVTAGIAALSAAVDEATSGTGPVDFDTAAVNPDDLEHIFTLDGVRYSVRKNPPRHLIVDYLRSVQKAGQNTGALSVATYDLLTTMIGTEAMTSLKNSPKVGDLQMEVVFSAVTRVAFAAIARLTEEFAGAVTPGN